VTEKQAAVRNQNMQQWREYFSRMSMGASLFEGLDANSCMRIVPCSVRLYNCTLNVFGEGATLGQLASYGWGALGRLKNLGLKTHPEAAVILELCGLELCETDGSVKCPTCGHWVNRASIAQ